MCAPKRSIRTVQNIILHWNLSRFLTVVRDGKKNSVQVTTSKTIMKWEAKRLSANNVQIFQFLLGRIINGWMVRNNIPGFQNEGPDDSTVWKGVFTIALAFVIHSYTQPTSMHIFSDSRRVS